MTMQNFTKKLAQSFIDGNLTQILAHDFLAEMGVLWPILDDEDVYNAPEGAIGGYHYFEFVLLDKLAMGYSPEFGVQFAVIS